MMVRIKHSMGYKMMLHRNRYKYRVLASLLLVFSGVIQAEPEKIILWDRNFGTSPMDQFLDLALQKTTDLFGPYEIVKSQSLEQGRAFTELKNNNSTHLTIAASATSVERETNLLPVAYLCNEVY